MSNSLIHRYTRTNAFRILSNNRKAAGQRMASHPTSSDTCTPPQKDTKLEGGCKPKLTSKNDRTYNSLVGDIEACVIVLCLVFLRSKLIPTWHTHQRNLVNIKSTKCIWQDPNKCKHLNLHDFVLLCFILWTGNFVTSRHQKGIRPVATLGRACARCLTNC